MIDSIFHSCFPVTSVSKTYWGKRNVSVEVLRGQASAKEIQWMSSLLERGVTDY